MKDVRGEDLLLRLCGEKGFGNKGFHYRGHPVEREKKEEIKGELFMPQESV